VRRDRDLDLPLPAGEHHAADRDVRLLGAAPGPDAGGALDAVYADDAGAGPAGAADPARPGAPAPARAPWGVRTNRQERQERQERRERRNKPRRRKGRNGDGEKHETSNPDRAPLLERLATLSGESLTALVCLALAPHAESLRAPAGRAGGGVKGWRMLLD